MKSTTKLIASAATAVVIFFSQNVKAQQSTSFGQVRFSVGAEVGAPTYQARSLSSVMAGGTGQLQVGLSNNLAAIATSGFYNFFDKTSMVNGVSVKQPGLGVVPVKVGLKGFLGNGVYFTAEGGTGFETSKDDATNQKDMKGILAGGLGYSMQSWDVGVRYESFMGQHFDYGIIGLRVAYGFTL